MTCRVTTCGNACAATLHLASCYHHITLNMENQDFYANFVKITTKKNK